MGQEKNFKRNEKINYYNLSHQQDKEEKSYNLNLRRSIGKSPTSIY